MRYSDELEFWVLRREPKRKVEGTKAAQIIELLRDGPLLYRNLRKKVKSIAPILIRELVDLEIIDRSGLTPTDLMHITGEFAPWDCDGALLLTRGCSGYVG